MVGGLPVSIIKVFTSWLNLLDYVDWFGEAER